MSHVDDPSIPLRANLLREAEALITGDRNITYGSPTQNFIDTAQMWTAKLRAKLQPGQEITPADVAWLMILLKACRDTAAPKRDNWTDAAGYAACGFEAQTESEAART